MMVCVKRFLFPFAHFAASVDSYISLIGYQLNISCVIEALEPTTNDAIAQFNSSACMPEPFVDFSISIFAFYCAHWEKQKILRGCIASFLRNKWLVSMSRYYAVILPLSQIHSHRFWGVWIEFMGKIAVISIRVVAFQDSDHISFFEEHTLNRIFLFVLFFFELLLLSTIYSQHLHDTAKALTKCEFYTKKRKKLKIKITVLLCQIHDILLRQTVFCEMWTTGSVRRTRQQRTRSLARSFIFMHSLLWFSVNKIWLLWLHKTDARSPVTVSAIATRTYSWLKWQNMLNTVRHHLRFNAIVVFVSFAQKCVIFSDLNDFLMSLVGLVGCAPCLKLCNFIVASRESKKRRTKRKERAHKKRIHRERERKLPVPSFRDRSKEINRCQEEWYFQFQFQFLLQRARWTHAKRVACRLAKDTHSDLAAAPLARLYQFCASNKLIINQCELLVCVHFSVNTTVFQSLFIELQSKNVFRIKSKHFLLFSGFYAGERHLVWLCSVIVSCKRQEYQK